MTSIPANQIVQNAAKKVLEYLAQQIHPGSTEASIALAATRHLADMGYPQTWYHQCPAFVLLGSRSLLSISGRDYSPAEEKVGQLNLVTVDLSPKSGEAYGDCARSFYIEDGVCRTVPVGEPFTTGHKVQRELHAIMKNGVSPQTTFHELFKLANDSINTLGFENLDFLGNVGHSLDGRPGQTRCFVEAGNHRRLGDVPCFTFEPHIRQLGGRWGFKHENVYYFNASGQATEL